MKKQYFTAVNTDTKTAIEIETFDNGIELEASIDDTTQAIVVRLGVSQVDELVCKLTAWLVDQPVSV